MAVAVSAMAALFILHAEVDSSSAQCIDYGVCGPDAVYYFDSDGTLEICGSGEMYNYDDVRAPWYSYRENITKIVIGEDITYLGKWAFLYCEHLKELTIPITLNAATADECCAFAVCYNIEKINFTYGKDGYGVNYSAYEGTNNWYQQTPWYLSRDSLKEIDFGHGIIHIGNDAFRELNITKIVLPDSVTSLGWHTFYLCTKLTDLTIPISLNSYDNENYPAFEGCTAVDKVTFTRGNGVAFDYSNWCGSICNPNLAPWNLNGSIAKTVVISDDVFGLGDYMFYSCNIRDITLPVNCISDRATRYAFEAPYTSLENVTITKGTGAGGDYYDWFSETCLPWNGTDSLKCVTVEEGVTYLGDYTFRNCHTEIMILPNSLAAVGRYTFSHSVMTDLTIPISLNAVRLDKTPAFCKVSGIEKITFVPGTGWGYNYGAYEDIDCWYQHTPWYQCRNTLKEIVFEDGIRHIGSDAFRELNITSLVIPDSVISLDNHTFFHCDKLTSLTIPMSLNSVYCDKYPAFDQCNALEYVHFTTGTDCIGFDYADQTGNNCWFGYTPWYLCKDTVKEMIIDDGFIHFGNHTFENYRFYDRDSQPLPSEARCLSGHTFTGENGELYLDDSISEASQDVSLSDCIAFFVNRSEDHCVV